MLAASLVGVPATGPKLKIFKMWCWPYCLPKESLGLTMGRTGPNKLRGIQHHRLQTPQRSAKTPKDGPPPPGAANTAANKPPETGQDGPETFQDGPKTAPNAPNRCPKALPRGP